MKLLSLALPVSLCVALCSPLALLGTQPRAQVLIEDFNDDSIDSTLWTACVYGSGPQIAEANHQLEIAIPGWSSGGDFGVKLTSNFLLRGDFDVQVDFRLLTWPFGNGVRMGLGTDEPGPPPYHCVDRISFGQNDYPWEPREAYLTDFHGTVCGVTATDDVTGSLRLVRSGYTQTGYYYGPGGWVAICTESAPTEDIDVKVAAWSAYQFMGWDVFAAFDDFIVNSGELVWPPTPVREITWGCIKALYR
jgi:hypothetical protein